MSHYTRVLSKSDEFPSIDELAELIRAEHPDARLSLESGEEEEWESLLLSDDDGAEIAVVEREPVFDGLTGQDTIADFLEDIEDCKPESGVDWLREFLDEVKTVYSFQHLQGADSEEGSAALHGLRSGLWERGESIIQADHEGFTNEEGFHIVWQFTDSVSGPWNMAVLQEGSWRNFTMDLGDPEHREAFWAGEVPSDAATVNPRHKQH